MKRFPKILTLILALVIIVTAFTVVSLAADPKAVSPAVTVNDFDNDNWTVGRGWGTNSGGSGTAAIQVAEAYPGGNKYIEITGTSTSSAKENYNNHFTNINKGGGDANTDYTIRTTYTVGKYPILAVDFDIMTPNGDWGLYSASNSGNSAGISMHRAYIGSKTYSSIPQLPIKEVCFGNMGLPTTAYVWHHITMIYEYYKEEVEGVETAYLKLSTYVNGVKVPETNTYCNMVGNMTTTYAGYNPDNVWIGVLSLTTSRYETTSKQALDNFKLTYCEAGYDVSALPTAIYNDSWEAPFGKLLATVTVGEDIEYFDDLNKAAEFAKANPGSTLALSGNMTAPYYVDSDITIDARKRDAEGNPTGEIYTGVVENAKTNVGYYVVETDVPGVYKSVMGDFMLTTSAGVGTAYPASELTAKLRSPGAGSIIKLLSDIDFDPSARTKSGGALEDGAIAVTTNFTLDLNGYALRRVYYYGNEYVADENGVYPEEPTAVAAKNGAFFDMENKTSSVLNIISTAATNGKLYNVGVKCDTWVKNGVIETREISSFTHNMLIYSISSGAKIDISNTDIYTGKILGAVWGNNFVTVRMNNCNFYQMSNGSAGSVSSNGEWIFQFHGNNGYDIQVENTLFYLNSSLDWSYTSGEKTNGTTGLFRSNEASPEDKTVVSIFKNCDIISAEGKHTAGLFNANSDDSLVFENCRFYNNDITENFVSTKGTLSNVGYGDPVNRKYPINPAIPASGWSNKNIVASIDYVVPAIDRWTATEGDVQSLDVSFGTKVQTCNFTKVVTKAVDVTLKVEGQEDKVVSLIPGVSNIYDKASRAYVDTESDMLLNQIYWWTDGNGNASAEILGYTSKGLVIDWDNPTLIGAAEVNGEKKFVGGIKADFNLSFLSGFRYNLYVPVDARLSDMVVEGFEKGENTVLIRGVEYTVYSKLIGTAAAADANVISATFKVDGAEYEQTWSVNAIQYAEWLIADPLYNSEKVALGSMVKFIKEAVLYLNAEADVTALNAVIESAALDLTYGDYTEGNANILELFGGAITNVNFVIYNGVASYKFITAAEDTEISFTVNGETIGFTRVGNDVILDAMRVYDIIDPITVTANGATAVVSMIDYLTALNDADGIDLAKALYEFGLAADAYKADIMAND